MTALQTRLDGAEISNPRFYCYAFYASQTNLALDHVVADAEVSDFAFSNRFIMAGINAGETWYTWAQAIYDKGAAPGPLVALGPVTADGFDPSSLPDHSIAYVKLQNVTSGKVLGRRTAGAGTVEELTLDKADVGLGNVDDTADAGKPVSTAQQTALDLKVNIARPMFCAYNSTVRANKTGKTGVYTVDFDTEEGDVGGNFAANTFTAPATGWYMLVCQVYMQGLVAGNNQADLTFRAQVSRDYYVMNENIGAARDVNNEAVRGGSIIIPLTAGQTVTVRLRVFGGATDNVSVFGSAARGTFFMGFAL